MRGCREVQETQTYRHQEDVLDFFLTLKIPLHAEVSCFTTSVSKISNEDFDHSKNDGVQKSFVLPLNKFYIWNKVFKNGPNKIF